MANEGRPAGAASELIAASKTILSQPRRTVRFDIRRTLAHRRIVRELDEWFGIFSYPDPAVVYAVAPTREAVLGE